METRPIVSINAHAARHAALIAPVVREAVAEGFSQAAIAAVLNANCLLTVKGRPWSKRNLQHLMRRARIASANREPQQLSRAKAQP